MEFPPCKISVIIPTYNRSATIEYCLDSILNQTYLPFEIIVVDDCSTDNTLAIVKSIDHPLIKAFQLERNQGAQAARNRGIQMAQGDWIAFQDSDDEWVADKLEKQVAALGNFGFDPFVVVHTGCKTVNPETGETKDWVVKKIDGENVYRELLKYPAPFLPAILTSKTALQQVGFLDNNVRSYQEWDTVISLSKYCRFVLLPEPLFIYYLHGGETISKDRSRDIEGYHFNRVKFSQEIRNEIGEAFLKTDLAWNLLRGMNWGLWQTASTLFYSNPILKSGLLAFYLRVLLKLNIKPKLSLYLLSKIKNYL